MTSTGSHQGLRAMLFTLSAIAGIAALVLVFVPNWPLSFAPGSVPPPSTAFEFAILRAFGIAVLVIAYLLCAAARDPIRYAAVIDGFIVLLVAFAILNVYWAVGQQLTAYYPSVYLIVRAVVQVILAVALYVLRPKRITAAA
jgi:hypothetical protein